MRSLAIIALFGLVAAEDEISMDEVMGAVWDAMDENGDGEIDGDEAFAMADRVRGLLVENGKLDEGMVSDDDLWEGIEALGEVLDEDENGGVSPEELWENAEEALALFEVELEDVPDMIMGMMDGDDEGEGVDLEEAKKACKRLGIEASEEDLKKLGGQMDKNDDGEVDGDELKDWGEEQLEDMDGLDME